MAMWLYQVNQKNWAPERYRLEIWENEKWAWRIGKSVKHGKKIQRGDTVVFFYTPSSGEEKGFYGWGIILEWKEDTDYLYFRPTTPSNYLKMIPWDTEEAIDLAKKIRNGANQNTLYYISDEFSDELKRGIHQWTTFGRVNE